MQPGAGKPIIYRVWSQAAGALSMLSSHSPDYVFTVRVSIFINEP